MSMILQMIEWFVLKSHLVPSFIFIWTVLLPTVQEVPFDGEIVRDPAWLSDGETIVYQTDSHDLKYRMVSYNIRTGFQREYKIPMDDMRTY